MWYQKCPGAEFEYLLAKDLSRWTWFPPTSTSPAVLLLRLLLPSPPSEPGLSAVEPDLDRADEKTVFLQHHYPTWLLDHCLSQASSSWIFLWCSDSMLNISWLFSLLIIFKRTSALYIRTHFQKRSGEHSFVTLGTQHLLDHVLSGCKEQKPQSAVVCKSRLRFPSQEIWKSAVQGWYQWLMMYVARYPGVYSLFVVCWFSLCLSYEVIRW